MLSVLSPPDKIDKLEADSVSRDQHAGRAPPRRSAGTSWSAKRTRSKPWGPIDGKLGWIAGQAPSFSPEFETLPARGRRTRRAAQGSLRGGPTGVFSPSVTRPIWLALASRGVSSHRWLDRVGLKHVALNQRATCPSEPWGLSSRWLGSVSRTAIRAHPISDVISPMKSVHPGDKPQGSLGEGLAGKRARWDARGRVRRIGTFFTMTNSTVLFAAGTPPIAFVMVRRSHKRGRLTKLPPVSPPPHKAHPPAGHHLDAPSAMGRWEVEMHELARDLSGQLDSKIVIVQQLVEEARQATARLEAMIQRAEQVGLWQCSSGQPDEERPDLRHYPNQADNETIHPKPLRQAPAQPGRAGCTWAGLDGRRRPGHGRIGQPHAACLPPGRSRTIERRNCRRSRRAARRSGTDSERSHRRKGHVAANRLPRRPLVHGAPVSACYFTTAFPQADRCRDKCGRRASLRTAPLHA